MKLKQIFLYACIVLTGGVLFTNLYNSLVDATSWGADIPNSIKAVREYYKSVSPGSCYKYCVILYCSAQNILLTGKKINNSFLNNNKPQL